MLNLVRLWKLTNEQADSFRSDFECIAKFLQKSYNKEKQMEMLMEDRQRLLHARNALHTFNSSDK